MRFPCCLYALLPILVGCGAAQDLPLSGGEAKSATFAPRVNDTRPPVVADGGLPESGAGAAALPHGDPAGDAGPQVSATGSPPALAAPDAISQTEADQESVTFVVEGVQDLETSVRVELCKGTSAACFRSGAFSLVALLNRPQAERYRLGGLDPLSVYSFRVRTEKLGQVSSWRYARYDFLTMGAGKQPLMDLQISGILCPGPRLVSAAGYSTAESAYEYAVAKRIRCRVQASLPNTGTAEKAVYFFTSEESCETALLARRNLESSYEAPVFLATGRHFPQSKIIPNTSLPSGYSFLVETLSGSYCRGEPYWFSFVSTSAF